MCVCLLALHLTWLCYPRVHGLDIVVLRTRGHGYSMAMLLVRDVPTHVLRLYPGDEIYDRHIFAFSVSRQSTPTKL